MPTLLDMNVSLDDAKFFDSKIQTVVRGPQQGHKLAEIRRYFRAYLHCWKTVLHFVRERKRLKADKAWVLWCSRWEKQHLETTVADVMNQLRTTSDYDTHSGTLQIYGEVASGLYPIVFVAPVKLAQARRELVTVTSQGLEILRSLIATHDSFR